MAAVSWPWLAGISVALGVLAGFTTSAVREHRARQAWLDTHREPETDDVFDQDAPPTYVTYGPCWSCGADDETCTSPAYCCVVCRHATNTHPATIRRDAS